MPACVCVYANFFVCDLDRYAAFYRDPDSNHIYTKTFLLICPGVGLGLRLSHAFRVSEEQSSRLASGQFHNDLSMFTGSCILTRALSIMDSVGMKEGNKVPFSIPAAG